MLLTRTLMMVAMVLALAACGAADQSSPDTDTTSPATAPHDEAGMGDHADAEHEEFPFGRPADATRADRTVAVDVGNNLVFEPAQVAVAAGETVTFSITNGGEIPHDFVIGDAAAQEQHAEEMAAMDDDMTMEGAEHGDANAVSVAAGETVELTWIFDGTTDDLSYACHEPGHYVAGMVGDIVVGP